MNFFYINIGDNNMTYDLRGSQKSKDQTWLKLIAQPIGKQGYMQTNIITLFQIWISINYIKRLYVKVTDKTIIQWFKFLDSEKSTIKNWRINETEMREIADGFIGTIFYV